VLGFVLKRLDYPLAPVVVGLILGPMAEIQFRRALQIAQGDYGVFLEKPIAAALLALAAILLILPPLLRARANRIKSNP
jgi:putative tricarboxylic transport membrane protein